MTSWQALHLSSTNAASPASIHPLINNMQQMNSWNPFVKKDPNLKGSYRGPAEGTGSAEESIYLMQLLAQLEKLGEGMRETALLVHAEGLSHAEAGAILGVSESTISWRVHTIRKHLSRPEARAGGGA